MKKLIYILTLSLSIALLTACGLGNNSQSTQPETTENNANDTSIENSENTAITTIDENKDVVIGVCPGPYGDMINIAIKPYLEDLGYSVKVQEFTDYVQPDLALGNGEIDANLMQHTDYLVKFATDHNLDLQAVISVPTAGGAIFSTQIESLDELKDGDTVLLPIDASNLARSLRILRDLDLIELADNIDETKITVHDISANPKNLNIVQIEAAQIERSLGSAAIGFVPGNYAIAAGLDFDDALAVENMLENYKNVIAIKGDNIDSQFAKDLKAAVESETFYEAIEDENNIFKSFNRPQWYIDKYQQ